MEPLMLPLFIINTVLIIADASLGYLLAPRLLRGIGDPDQIGQAVRPTRTLLSIVVALYMFFNCRGYFLAEPAWLVAVLVLVVADMLLQNWLARRNVDTGSDEEDE